MKIKIKTMSETLKRGLEKLGELIQPLAELEERYIGFLDFLGFSEIVKYNPKKFLEQIYSLCYNISLINISSKMKSGFFDGMPIGFADLSDVLVNMLFFSDSIIVWSENLSIDSFHKMLIVMSRFLINGFQSNFPIRGALTKGLFSYNPRREDTNLMVSGQLVYGPGLVAAFDLEKDQMWSGCVIDNDCLRYYDELVKNKNTITNAGIDALLEHNWVVRYTAPFRKKNVESYVINWNIDKNFDKLKIEEAFHDYNKPTDSESVKSKIKNTIDFLEFTSKL